MAVSGCLNDWAEACISDIALLGTTKGWHLQVGGNGGGVPEPGLPEHIPSEEEVLVIVERLIAWFVAQNRCCRLGKTVDEVGRDEVRRVALGEGVERS